MNAPPKATSAPEQTGDGSTPFSPAPTRGRKLIRWGVVLGTGLAALALLGTTDSLWSLPPEEASRSVPVWVHTVRVEWEEFYDSQESYLGRVEASRRSEVGFELGGQLLEVLADEGDTVTQGQVIARLDTDRLKARKKEIAALRDQRLARVELARISLEREKNLLGSGATSVQRFDEATYELKRLEASHAEAEAQLDRIVVDIEKSQLRAPFSGIISRRMADEGRVLEAGLPLFELLEMGRLELRAGVSPEMAANVRVGQMLEIRLRDQNLSAPVQRVLPDRDSTTRTVDIICALPPEAQGIRDGDLARIAFTQSIAARGFWLPRTALTQGTRGLWSVLIATREGAPGEGRLERRMVELIHEEGQRVFVRGPLEPGQEVVAEGLHQLVPGQLARLKQP
ncbi:MAG: efflux RND transporter periplasmic adaptor subunit [Verrucomicrobiota bacterium]